MGVWAETSIFFAMVGELSFRINNLAACRGGLKEVACSGTAELSWGDICRGIDQKSPLVTVAYDCMRSPDSRPCSAKVLGPAPSPQPSPPIPGGEGAFLPLAGEGRGEGHSFATTAVLNFIANQEIP